VVIVNAGDRGIVAFFNACPHRGASLVPQGMGSCDPLAVQCRYHGRRFAVESLEQLFLRVSAGGWLVACDEADTRQCRFADMLRSVDSVAQTTGGEGLRFVSERKQVVWADWRVVVENALDREHVASVHRDTLAGMRLGRYGLEDFGGGSSLELFCTGDAAVADRLCRLAPILRGDGTAAHPSCDYFHAFLFPHSALSATSGGVFFLQSYLPLVYTQPHGDGACLVTCRSYARPGASKAAVQAVVEANTRVLDEDTAACELVKVWSSGLLQGALDDRIRLFRTQLEAQKGSVW
jgi:hypothetical protein